jgi:hypothetical protein
MYSSFVLYLPEDVHMVCWNMYEVIVNITNFNILVSILLVRLLHTILIQLNEKSQVTFPLLQPGSLLSSDLPGLFSKMEADHYNINLE